MTYPTTGNLAPIFVDLSRLAFDSRQLHRKATEILNDIRPALLGQRVARYGRTWEICQVQVSLGGNVTCYGHAVNKRGKVGTRGFDLGSLEHCEFLAVGQ